MEQKKKCGCNIKHKSQAAWIKCFRANVDPSYGNKKKQKKVVQQMADIDQKPQPCDIQPAVMTLRSRQVERVEVPQNIIQSARQLFSGKRNQGVDDIQRRKNVLWLNAIKILRVRGNHCSSLQKGSLIKKLMKYRQIYWHSIQNYIESKTVLIKHADKNLAEQNVDEFWERFRARNQRNQSIFRDMNICEFMTQYYDYCIQNDFLLGQYDSFNGQFSQLGRFILPMTPFRFNVLLKKNWQLYCIYRGNRDDSMESFIAYIKKDALKKYLKQNYSHRVFQKDIAYKNAQVTINRIFIAAWYGTTPSLVKQVVKHPSIWKSFLKDITTFRQRIADRNLEVFIIQQQKKRQATGFYDQENGVTIHIEQPKITFDLPLRFDKPEPEPEPEPIKGQEKDVLKIEEIFPLNLQAFPKPTSRAIGESIRIQSRSDRTLRLQKNFDDIMKERKLREEEEAKMMLLKKKKK